MDGYDKTVKKTYEGNVIMATLKTLILDRASWSEAQSHDGGRSENTTLRERGKREGRLAAKVESERAARPPGVSITSTGLICTSLEGFSCYAKLG